MMKKQQRSLLIIMLVLNMLPCFAQNSVSRDGWNLVWEENFDQPESFDPSSWSKIPRGTPDSRIETDKQGQFPFDQPYYLLIDMQLGGSWVGKVYSEDLPAEMWVDWVRFYQKD